MLQEQYIEKLLGLKGVFLLDVREEEEQTILEIAVERAEHTCPECGTPTSQVHDYRRRKVRDLSLFGKNVVLYYHRRRYRCPDCGKRFAESNSFVTGYRQFTNRSLAHLVSSFAQMRSATSIAREHNCSVTTAIRYFDLVRHPLPHLPEVLSIDEFKGNAGGEKFQCILTNPKKRQVLDILPSRKLEELCRYFSQFPRAERINVRYVVMDMSKEFQSLVKRVFPNARIVVDKFHVVRYVNWALERVRIRVQKSFVVKRRRYFKRSRYLLHKRKDALTPEKQQRVALMLSLSEELGKAYWLKELFYDVMKSPTRVEAQSRLKYWMLAAQVAQLPEFLPVITTLSNWSKEFLNAFSTKLTNGFTEGMNNRTKVLKRTCYGVRQFERFRNRILYLQTDSDCRHTSSTKKKKAT